MRANEVKMGIRLRGEMLRNLMPQVISFLTLEAGLLRGRDKTEVKDYMLVTKVRNGYCVE